MRRGKHRKFGREAIQRKALMKALATALVEHGRITTTRAKAKELAPHVEKLVTKAKKNTLAARRDLMSDLGETAVEKLMAEVAPKMATRPGGYTRVIPMARRHGDGSEMAIIEFTS